MSASAGTCVVACGAAGVYVVDVQDPTALAVDSWVATADYATATALVGGTVYAADRRCGFRIVDVNTPSAAAIAGGSTVGGWSVAIATAPDLLLVGGDAGLAIFPRQCDGLSAVDDSTPARARTVWNFPNPFNPQTEIAFTLTEPSMVSIAIYDVAGRLVTALVVDELYPAGANSVAWRGVDLEGRSAPAGVYLYTVDDGRRRQVGRMTLVR